MVTLKYYACLMFYNQRKGVMSTSLWIHKNWTLNYLSLLQPRMPLEWWTLRWLHERNLLWVKCKLWIMMGKCISQIISYLMSASKKCIETIVLTCSLLLSKRIWENLYFFCEIWHSEMFCKVLFRLLIITCGILKGPILPSCLCVYFSMFVQQSVWGYSHLSINGWPHIVKGNGRRFSFSVVVAVTTCCQNAVQQVYCGRANTAKTPPMSLSKVNGQHSDYTTPGLCRAMYV